MSESKVAPINGRYETVQAMAAHVMGDADARSGIFFYFDADDVMHSAHIGVTEDDVGRIFIRLLKMAQDGL